MPSCARPAATPIISCSRMPTLITRSGCRSRGAVRRSCRRRCRRARAPAADRRRAACDVTRVKRSRMVSTVMPPPGRRRRAAGPAAPASIARSSASWSRACALAVVQPSLLEAVRDAVGPAVGGAEVVDDDRGQAVEAEAPGERDRLVVGALGELAVAQDADHARSAASLRAQRERAADGDRQAVAERAARDLDARDQRGVGMVPERASRSVPNVGELVDRDEALGGEHGVVGRRPVALREQQAVALGIVGRLRRHVEDAVVEHPVEVERGRGAGIVLRVAPEQREQPGQIVVAGRGRRERGGRGHALKLQSQVHLKSSNTLKRT